MSSSAILLLEMMNGTTVDTIFLVNIFFRLFLLSQCERDQWEDLPLEAFPLDLLEM